MKTGGQMKRATYSQWIMEHAVHPPKCADGTCQCGLNDLRARIYEAMEKKRLKQKDAK